ncbi:MAG: hypothetical protein ACLVFT_00480, partial [Megasphaera lornae]
PALQAGCRQFDPVIAHHREKTVYVAYNINRFFCIAVCRRPAAGARGGDGRTDTGRDAEGIAFFGGVRRV